MYRRKTQHHNFVYRPAICQLTKYDVSQFAPDAFSDDTFLVYQSDNRVFSIKFTCLYDASWELVYEELLQWTPLPEDILNYVLKEFLVGGGLPLFPESPP